MTGKWKKEKDNIMQRLHRNRPVEMQWFPEIYSTCIQQQQSFFFFFTDMSKIRSWNRQERMCLWKQAHWGRQQWRNCSLVSRQRDAYGEHCTPRLPSQHIWTRAWQFSLVIVRVVGEKRAPLSSFQRAKSYKQITRWTHQTFSYLRQMSRANTFYGLVQF